MPIAVGVPEITPVAAVNVMPLGSVPVTSKLTGSFNAVIVYESGMFTSLTTRPALVMIGGPLSPPGMFPVIWYSPMLP